MFSEALPRAARPRATLPPNLYSGAFLLASFLSLAKSSFIRMDEVEGTRIYLREGRYYTVPKVDHEPAPGYNWQPIGKARTRIMYVATRKLMS